MKKLMGFVCGSDIAREAGGGDWIAVGCEKMNARWERVQQLAEEVEKRVDGEVWLKKVEADERVRREVMGLVHALAAEQAVRLGPEAAVARVERSGGRRWWAAAVVVVLLGVGGWWGWPGAVETEEPGNVLVEMKGQWPRLKAVAEGAGGLLALEELETAMFELRGKVSAEQELRLEVEAARRQAELGSREAARRRVERALREAKERGVESARLRREAAAVLKRLEN